MGTVLVDIFFIVGCVLKQYLLSNFADSNVHVFT